MTSATSSSTMIVIGRFTIPMILSRTRLTSRMPRGVRTPTRTSRLVTTAETTPSTTRTPTTSSTSSPVESSLSQSTQRPYGSTRHHGGVATSGQRLWRLVNVGVALVLIGSNLVGAAVALVLGVFVIPLPG